MNYPTIKQLRYFIALVDHNHFGKAAMSCFVSQSAFSVAIKELESTLNGRLVDRTNKSVTVTNLGRETYNQAKLIMSEMSRLVDISQGNQVPLSGRLSLGIIPTIAPFILPTFIKELQEDYPKLQLFLYEDMTLKLYEKLMKGELDVILMAMPYALKNIESCSLFKDKFFMAYYPESKWITKNKKHKEPTDESILLLEDGHCMREHALSACNLKSPDKVSQFSASSILTLIEMVKSDIGITYLPEMSLDSHIVKQANLIIDPLKSEGYREIGLVWRKGSSRSKEFKILGNYIKNKNK